MAFVSPNIVFVISLCLKPSVVSFLLPLIWDEPHSCWTAAALWCFSSQGRSRPLIRMEMVPSDSVSWRYESLIIKHRCRYIYLKGQHWTSSLCPSLVAPTDHVRLESPTISQVSSTPCEDQTCQPLPQNSVCLTTVSLHAPHLQLCAFYSKMSFHLIFPFFSAGLRPFAFPSLPLSSHLFLSSKYQSQS